MEPFPCMCVKQFWNKCQSLLWSPLRKHWCRSGVVEEVADSLVCPKHQAMAIAAASHLNLWWQLRCGLSCNHYHSWRCSSTQHRRRPQQALSFCRATLGGLQRWCPWRLVWWMDIFWILSRQFVRQAALVGNIRLRSAPLLVHESCPVKATGDRSAGQQMENLECYHLHAWRWPSQSPCQSILESRWSCRTLCRAWTSASLSSTLQKGQVGLDSAGVHALRQTCPKSSSCSLRQLHKSSSWPCGTFHFYR